MSAEMPPHTVRYYSKFAAMLFLIPFLNWPGGAQTPAAAAQAKSATDASPDAALRELNEKYPGLLQEFGQFATKLQSGVQFPAPRRASRMLRLLPEGTILYAAIPNYGDAAQQTLKILRQELQESTVLRDWLRKNGAVSTTELKIEDSLDKLHQLNEYLGNEIVVSGAMAGSQPAFLMVAEVRKPGLKEFLQQSIDGMYGRVKPGVRVFDSEGMAAEAQAHAKELHQAGELLVVVRPDFVSASTDLPTLETFNARLDQPSVNKAVMSAFSERVEREYKNGVTTIGGADVGTILSQIPAGPNPEQSWLQRSGFSDAKYFLWDHTRVADQALSQMELSFNAPRRGAAAWLAKSGPLSNLDFVSPKAMMAATVVLANPVQLFDDIKAFESGSGQNSFAALGQFEKILKLSLRDDVLAELSGEVTLELDDIAAPKPTWKAIFKVKDAAHLQETFAALLAGIHLEAQQSDQGAIASTRVVIRAAQTSATSGASTGPTEITYAFADGHLILGSSPEAVVEAIRLHGAGKSLAKSKTLEAALLPGGSIEASALVYQDPMAMPALQLRQFAPELAESVGKLVGQNTPAVIGVYADDTTIREASRSSGFDVGAALVVAAVAIPSLLRSRVAANEASAVGSVRTIVSAQVTYSETYPDRDYAPSLASLGPSENGRPTPERADLVDAKLANQSCAGEGWCTKSGYLFRVESDCKLRACREYVVTATPENSNSGTRSFCAASDGIIRATTGPPLRTPLSVAECRKWAPLP